MDHGSSSTALEAWIMYSFGLVRQAHLGDLRRLIAKSGLPNAGGGAPAFQTQVLTQ